jgi:hypothetical protein
MLNSSNGALLSLVRVSGQYQSFSPARPGSGISFNGLPDRGLDSADGSRGVF